MTEVLTADHRRDDHGVSVGTSGYAHEVNKQIVSWFRGAAVE
jgi:hypothetical protein